MQIAVDDFKKIFKSSASAIVNDAPVDALDGEGAEQITRYVAPAVKK